MPNYFITNEGTKDLRRRLIQLIGCSKELNFLIGFFYFSGIRELYEGLKGNQDFILKVLVGLDVDKLSYGLIEFSKDEKYSNEERINNFFTSVKTSINSDYFDNKEFYEQVRYFIDLIKNDRLIIRKTYKPNHSKLYLFYLEESQVGRSKLFITGSSNLTRAGLSGQNEFNVEISDYGFDEAEKYFNELWEDAVKINEEPDLKEKLIHIIEDETLIKEITPFEAYALVLKSYLDSFEGKEIGTSLLRILDEKGYKKYQYQLDAVKYALSVIEKHNGVLIADVVGLGKTVIACMIAKHLKSRGLVICPPGLIGDENKTEGWKKYLNEFQLYDWEVRSLGDLENTLEFVRLNDDIQVIVVDEAHRFRNQDTKGYEQLKNICRDKKVILLTATPFNNKPEDVLSLLNLFIIPKKSSITLNDDLISVFRTINRLFDDLAFIKKNYNSKERKKLNKAKKLYKAIFDDDEIDLTKVKRKSHSLAKQIRDVIEPITIRRNRLDLLKNPVYKNEVKELSVVDNPQEWFYDLTEEQSKFYDEIITKYFADPDEEGGKFKGAIYRPFEYEKGYGTTLFDEEKDKEENREYIQQRNLFDIMRRLIIKRFESSFGAFEQSIKNFKHITETVLKFIEKTGNGEPLKGEYILDRDLLERIVELDSDEIQDKLKEYEDNITKGVYPKKHKRYKIENFKSKKNFIDDIKSDIKLFDEVINKLNELKLIDNDPKVERLLNNVEDELNKLPLNNGPKRKIVIFSEYADTVEYVYDKISRLKPDLAKRTLVVTGSIPQSKITIINKNFDASAKEQDNDYDILLSTDKLSEGFNLNRAGMVINYDIPWNPVRVIQRLGRINRISKKVFEKLYIVNFFPTERGAEFVKSREIAQNKMFMIHNTLGEDSKIFDVDEEPFPAKLYQKLTQNIEEAEDESLFTKVFNLYNEIKEQHPEVIKRLNNFPKRVKVIKQFNEDEMIVCFMKNRMYIKVGNENGIMDSSLELIIDKIKCDCNEKPLPIDDDFWNLYESVKENKEKSISPKSQISNEKKALNNIDNLIRRNGNERLLIIKNFLRTIREDLIDYGTLPDYTIRRLASLKLKEDDLQSAIEEIESIKNELGEDYLEKEKKKLQKADKEIIIAIMNKKP
ncbi:helicase-related protein [Melioribacteraceae bacterium 4301-Me]|uniref:helicase-related protein n=1 Tax=Pyranulibacter aquaticus TaxID=3163344 RepID=UPI00359B240E